jgi:hypothetical protein
MLVNLADVAFGGLRIVFLLPGAGVGLEGYFPRCQESSTCWGCPPKPVIVGNKGTISKFMARSYSIVL